MQPKHTVRAVAKKIAKGLDTYHLGAIKQGHSGTKACPFASLNFSGIDDCSPDLLTELSEL